MKKIYEYYPEISIVFDINPFDKNADTRQVLFDYLKHVFSIMDSFQRGCLINQLLWPTERIKNITGDLMKLIKKTTWGNILSVCENPDVK